MRVHDFGDRLVVHVGPRRRTAIFLGLWLVGWTAFGPVGLDEADRLFGVIWLTAWAIGEIAVGGVVAWHLFGRESLVVTSGELVLHRQLWRFERAKSFRAELVHAVRPARLPSDDESSPRKNFCLLVWYADDKVYVGSGMDEAEARLVAATVEDRLRPRGGVLTPAEEMGAVGAPLRLDRSLSGVVVLVLVVAGVGLASTVMDEEAPSRKTHLGRFSDPEEYAAAETRFSLENAVGDPECDGATWSRWTCRVEARVDFGTSAGRTVTYLCSRRRVPSVEGRPSYMGTVCWQEQAGPPDDSMFQVRRRR